MNTGVSTSKARRQLSTIAAVTGSVAIIAIAIAFVTNDFSGMLQSSVFHVNDSTISALEPIRSDSMSEQNGDGNNGDTGDDNGIGLLPDSENNNDTKDDPNDDYPEHGLPCLDPDCSIHHDPEGDHERPCDDPDCEICNERPPVDIPMEIINFKSDSADYVDTKAAMDALSGYVDAFNAYFEKYPDSKIYLVGCIAKIRNWSFTDTYLSQKRAEAVRNSLIELGIDGDKLVAIGIGANDPWRADEWSEGYFNEDKAKINRRVWIVPDEYKDQIGLLLSIKDEIEKAR